MSLAALGMALAMIYAFGIYRAIKTGRILVAWPGRRAHRETDPAIFWLIATVYALGAGFGLALLFSQIF